MKADQRVIKTWFLEGRSDDHQCWMWHRVKRQLRKGENRGIEGLTLHLPGHFFIPCWLLEVASIRCCTAVVCGLEYASGELRNPLTNCFIPISATLRRDLWTKYCLGTLYTKTCVNVWYSMSPQDNLFRYWLHFYYVLVSQDSFGSDLILLGTFWFYLPTPPLFVKSLD